MKVTYRQKKNGKGEIISVPVIDVRDGKAERKEVSAIEKASRGKYSQYIPNRHLSRY